MPNEINVGDVVVLKSGGPEMTVEKFFTADGAQAATCVWFVQGDELKTGQFRVTSLKAAPKQIGS